MSTAERVACEWSTCRKGTRVDWKLQLLSTVLYFVVVLCGFMFIPTEPPLFGMGLIPGTRAILRAFGVPLVASLGISVVVHRKARSRKTVNAAFFLLCSIILWAVVGSIQ